MKMGFIGKLKDQFSDRDDFDDEELDEVEETSGSSGSAAPVPTRSAGKSAATVARTAKPYTMVVVNPKNYDDAAKIGDHLKQARPVVMNLEKTDVDEAQRIVDFVQGIMYALDGRIDQISENIYLCAPNNMSVSKETFAPYTGEAAPVAPAWDPTTPPQP